MIRTLVTVTMILLFAWCVLPVPSFRSLVSVALASHDLQDHWQGGVTVVTVDEPVATFDDRFTAVCEVALCKI